MFISIQSDVINFDLVKIFKKKESNLEIEYINGNWTYYNYNSPKKAEQVFNYLKSKLNEKIIREISWSYSGPDEEGRVFKSPV